MTTQATRMPDVVDCRNLVSDGQVLFVLGERSDYGHDGFSLPYTDGIVIGTSLDDASSLNGSFDALFVDETDLAATVRSGVLTSLRAGAHVVVTQLTGPDRIDPETATSDVLEGLSWRGLGMLAGHPCAVLTVAQRSGQESSADVPAASDTTPVTTTLFSTVKTAFDLGAAYRAEDNEWAETQRDTVSALAQQLKDSRQSEYALLRQLEVLVTELAEQRRRTHGLVSVASMLRRRRTGRLLIRVLRVCRQAVRKARRSQVGRLAGRLRRKLHV